MKQHLITLETAKLALEQGFDEKHADFYIDKDQDGDLRTLPSVPQSFLQKWLREEHNIQMILKPFYDSLAKIKCTFVCDVIEIVGSGRVTKSHRCSTYEEALEIGLVNGLYLVKELNKTK